MAEQTWFDREGNIISADIPDGERPTAYRWDDQRNHWAWTGTPGPVPDRQALTLCGVRALEIPGRGPVDCPECIEVVEEVARG